MEISRLLTLKLLCLFIGCLAKFTTGSLFVFNVYQNAIKDTFNYTQQEVELMSSMLNMGLGIGFLPGMFFDRFGPQLTSFVGLLVSVSAYMLIWSTTRYVHFYSSNAWLMAIYFFICGLGSVFTYMVALNTNVINFNPKYSGMIVGILNAFFAGSPSIYATIYYNVFTHGDSTVTSNQDYPGFMLMFAISFAVVDILCIIFMKLYPDENPLFERFDQESSNDVVGVEEHTTIDPHHEVFNFKNGTSINSNVSPPSPAVNPLAEREMSLTEILMTFDYQILIWMIGFASAIGLVYANNITVISKSVKLDHHDNVLTIIIPITNAVVSAAVGIFSDYFKDRLPRTWILIACCVFFTLSQVLVFIFADVYGILILSLILLGIGIAILWTITPTVVKENFYVGNLGRNWGIAILLAALIGFGIQEAFGAIYDHKATGTVDQKVCYGMQCVRGGTAVVITCGGISIALGLIMQLKQRCCKRN
ncbi:uncharacterized protein LOC127860954 [Dreissena polymorpha]|uniref:Nodulin-like domain-containing protein n=1 Tax=Dreissena polymorpha TaxID=45954 RepID=A0A9D3YQU8_DREPO|nr:uncharacterized protein LOC127860954 [Dreissena polymorpha]KAH3704436.1 hypothetical protein DPMN_079492 [Dreissena polymorpha]